MQADAEIVGAVHGGDREAFAVLVSRYEREAWATAWRVLRDDHVAVDAAQESFFQAFRRLGDLRQPEQFGVWLLRIARRESIRMMRKRVHDPSRFPGPGWHSNAAGPDGTRNIAMRTALNRASRLGLTCRCRRTVRRRRWRKSRPARGTICS